jgi:hypothetical protein
LQVHLLTIAVDALHKLARRKFSQLKMWRGYPKKNRSSSRLLNHYPTMQALNESP